MEERFDRRIGVLVRQYIYAATLSDSASGVRTALLDGVSAAQTRLSCLIWPVMRRLMVASMNARPALLSEVEAQLGAELDWFDRRVDGRRHLVGDRLGRADITAASLLAPLARPRACPLYRQVTLPSKIEETLMTWSARPALQWVQRLYAEHRP